MAIDSHGLRRGLHSCAALRLGPFIISPDTTSHGLRRGFAPLAAGVCSLSAGMVHHLSGHSDSSVTSRQNRGDCSHVWNPVTGVTDLLCYRCQPWGSLIPPDVQKTHRRVADFRFGRSRGLCAGARPAPARDSIDLRNFARIARQTRCGSPGLPSGRSAADRNQLASRILRHAVRWSALLLFAPRTSKFS
jgi:hypothetical protein